MFDLSGDLRDLRFIGLRLDASEIPRNVLPAAQEFCRHYGEDPHEVAWVSWHPNKDGSGAHIAFGVYLNDAGGGRYLDCHADDPFAHTSDCTAAIEVRAHPLDVDAWPSWWIPAEPGSWFHDTRPRDRVGV